MTTPLNRRQALKALALTGLGAALSACLSPAAKAYGNPQKASVFDTHRNLANSFWVGPNLFSFLAEANTMGGSYTLVEASSPPGAVIAPHTHTREDETVFMLGGELEVTVNDVVRLARPGDLVFMPRGGVHTFRVTSDVPAQVMVMFAPGGWRARTDRSAGPPSASRFRRHRPSRHPSSSDASPRSSQATAITSSHEVALALLPSQDT